MSKQVIPLTWCFFSLNNKELHCPIVIFCAFFTPCFHCPPPEHTGPWHLASESAGFPQLQSPGLLWAALSSGRPRHSGFLTLVATQAAFLAASPAFSAPPTPAAPPTPPCVQDSLDSLAASSSYNTNQMIIVGRCFFLPLAPTTIYWIIKKKFNLCG